MTVFKVSLLPASYRKYLEGKKKKDLIIDNSNMILEKMKIKKNLPEKYFSSKV